MRPIDAFIPEIMADLIDALEATDHEPLEVQLIGDPQVQGHVERVVVRQEGTRRGAAVLRLQHRRLDFHVP